MLSNRQTQVEQLLAKKKSNGEALAALSAQQAGRPPHQAARANRQ